MSFLGFEAPPERRLTYASDAELGLADGGGSFLERLGEVYFREAQGRAQDTVGAGVVADVAEGRVRRLWDAAIDQARFVENPLAASAALEEATRRRLKAIQDATGVSLENPELGGYRAEARAAARQAALEAVRAGSSGGGLEGGLPGEARRILQSRLDALAQNFPDKADVIKAGVPLIDDARALAKAAELELEGAAGAMRNTALQVGTGFAGGAAGYFYDPLNLATMFVGAGPSSAGTAAARIGATALREALINAGVTALTQPAVQAWRDEIGVRSGVVPALENIGMAALFGGLFGAAFEGARALLPKGKRPLVPGDAPLIERVATGRATAREVQQLFDLLGAKLAEDDAAALKLAADLEDADAALPKAPDGIAPEAHAEALTDAIRHAEAPDEAPPPSPPAAAPPARAAQPILADETAPAAALGPSFAYDGKPVTRDLFDPRELQVDAETFQFKQGGDDEGVTTRLRSVRAWDNLAAGNVVVWERADGVRFVADGHQRTGLARRLLEADPEQNIQVSGFVFKEADGWTPADVRAIAAKKNIQEGSGALLDVARVLRDRPDLWDATLPVTDERLTKARALSTLSDEAWGAVVNGRVDPLYASHIAALAPSPHWHAALIRELVENDPPNEAAARFLISDALAAGLSHEVQETMFGMIETAASLRKERAAVFDAARKMLAQEKRLFGGLEAQAGRIEAAGNTLSRETNQALAQTAGTLAQLVEKLATRAGPVSDALNRAAIALKEGGKKTRVAQTFVADLADLIEREGLAGLEARPALEPARAIEPGSPEAAAEVEAMLGPGLFGDEPQESPRTAENGAPARSAADNGQASPRPPEPQERAMGAPGLVAQGEVDASATKKAWRAASPYTDPEAMLAAAPANQERLGAVGRAISEELEGVTFKNPGVKAKARAEIDAIADPEKRAKAEKGHARFLQKVGESPKAGHVTDLVRAGFLITDPAAGEAIVARLAQEFELLDEQWFVNQVGYFDRKLYVRFADGMIGELQIWEPSLLKAKGDTGHALYERARVLKDGDPAKAALEQEMEALYRPLVAGLSDEWRAALGSGNSPNRALNSSADSARESIATSAELAGTQAPSRNTNARPGDQSTGSPSSDPNLKVTGTSDTNINVADRLRNGPDGGARQQGEQAVEATAAGDQTLIPGVQPVTLRQRLEARAARELGGTDQPMPAGGLFDTDARLQTDLLEAIRAAERTDGLGDLVAACKV